MPELPEVEVVRSGLTPYVLGATITDVAVEHPRSIRTVEGGAAELIGSLQGREVTRIGRRGKFLWFEFTGHGDSACGSPQQGLLVHLGMSGQMLIKTQNSALHPHRRIRTTIVRSDAQEYFELWFVDQRTFGYWAPTTFVETAHGCVPAQITHIARDLLDPQLKRENLARLIRKKNSEIKRVLLNQEIVSGIGNIYADEMLWAARIHPQTSASHLSVAQLSNLLEHGQRVMNAALDQGGTSFDSLYVNVNGQSGYFDVSLHAYGQQGQACDRCGSNIIREKFANRSSHFCPRCQLIH